MAVETTNLNFSQVTRITSGGVFQLVDPTPLFLEKTLILVDLSLVSGSLTIILPDSSQYGLGASQQFVFQTYASLGGILENSIKITSYTPPEGSGQLPDRVNGELGYEYSLKPTDWLWCQLVTPTRWIGVAI